MNIYKFELPYGFAVVYAKTKDEAIDIWWNGDGRKEGLCGREYFGGSKVTDILDDDEPYLIDTSKPRLIGFHCG